MDDDDRADDVRYQLTRHADHLNAIDTPDPGAVARYEILSGALIWSDEVRNNTPFLVISSLRMLFHYRTHLMRTSAEPSHEFWDQCMKLFPKWIGWLPERRRPTPELLAEYRRGSVSLRWCLRKAEREMDAEVGGSK